MTLFLRPVPSRTPGSRKGYSQFLHEQAHLLLEETLADKGVAAPLETCLRRADSGKPYLPGSPLMFNLTHCDGLVACVLGTFSCGVDGEPVRRPVPSVAKRICSPEELSFLEESTRPAVDFFRLWTLKEAYVKTIGTGLSYPLSKAVFLPRDGGLCFCGEGYGFAQFFTGTHILSVCTQRENTTVRPVFLQKLMKLEENQTCQQELAI